MKKLKHESGIGYIDNVTYYDFRRKAKMVFVRIDTYTQCLSYEKVIEQTKDWNELHKGEDYEGK